MEAPGLRRRLEDVFQGTEVLLDETDKPPAVPPPTPGAPVQTSDTSACSDRKGSLIVRVSMRSRGVLLRAEPLQVQAPRCAPRLLGSLPPDCGTLMLLSLRAWDVARTSVASKAVFLLCSRGGRLIVPHLRLRNKTAAEALASRKFLVEDVESLALPAALSIMGALARGCVLELRNLQKLTVRGLTTGSTSAAVLACCLPHLPSLSGIELDFKESSLLRNRDEGGREGTLLLAAAKVSTLRCLVLEGGHAFFCCHEELETALKYLAPRLETLALIGGATYTVGVRGRKSLVQDVIEMLGKESMQLSSLRTLQFGEVCNDDGIPRGFRRRKMAGVLRACPRLQVLLLGRETPYQSASRRGLCFEPGILGHNILVGNFERSLLGPVSAGHAPYLREVRLVQPRPAAAAEVRQLQDLREAFAHKGIAFGVMPIGVRLAISRRSRSRAGYARADACVAASRAPASAPGDS